MTSDFTLFAATFSLSTEWTKWTVAFTSSCAGVFNPNWLVGMAFGTADHNLVEFRSLFWSRIVLRFVALHCLPRPRQTDLHDLHADPTREIRGHLVHARSFLDRK